MADAAREREREHEARTTPSQSSSASAAKDDTRRTQDAYYEGAADVGSAAVATYPGPLKARRRYSALLLAIALWQLPGKNTSMDLLAAAPSRGDDRGTVSRLHANQICSLSLGNRPTILKARRFRRYLAHHSRRIVQREPHVLHEQPDAFEQARGIVVGRKYIHETTAN